MTSPRTMMGTAEDTHAAHELGESAPTAGV